MSKTNINLDFEVKPRIPQPGLPQAEPAWEQIVVLLDYARGGDFEKYGLWAKEIYANKKIELDKVDYDRFHDFVKASGLFNYAKEQIMAVINAAKPKE